jgi:hypothetical protein
MDFSLARNLSNGSLLPYTCAIFNTVYVTDADPWSITMTSVANGCCMGVVGIILVSSGLLAASLIPSNVDIIYISVGLLAGKFNPA